MIEIVKPTGTKTPHYVLACYYMIGDADGYTSYDMQISADEDTTILEKFVLLLNKIGDVDVPGHIGFMFDDESVRILEEHNILSTEELHFLKYIINPWSSEDSSDYMIYMNNTYTEEQLETLQNYIDTCIRSEMETTFLIFEYISLTYVDEIGIIYDTIIK